MNMEEMEMLKKYQQMLKDELFGDLGKEMDECACNYNKHKMIASVIKTINDINCLVSYDNGDWSKDGSKPAAYVAEEPHLTPEQIDMWVSHMRNSDGTVGEHWSKDTTTAVAEQYGVAFDHISPCCWYATMNMMYSDYGKTLESIGVTDVGAYVEMSKDFLFDDDAVPPKEKLYYYYKYIVKK